MAVEQGPMQEVVKDSISKTPTTLTFGQITFSFACLM
jgi:hypothetical protein